MPNFTDTELRLLSLLTWKTRVAADVQLAGVVGVTDSERPAFVRRLKHLARRGFLTRHLVAVDCPAPVSFFAYPGKASTLAPEGAIVHHVGGTANDPVAMLEAIAEALGAPDEVEVASASRPERPTAVGR